MFNLSRQVKCPECRKLTAWKGRPEFTDRLYCQHCDAFITLYEDYLRDLLRQDISTTMAKYKITSAYHDTAMTKDQTGQHRTGGSWH